MAKKLTNKQARFVEEYLVDLNATAAARRAGYSAKNADRIGPELLGKSWVSDAIHRAQAKRSARTGVTQDQVIEELRKIAMAEASDEKGSVLRYQNKLRALELLGKHLGMFRERVTIDAGEDGEALGVVVLAPVMEPTQPPEEEPDA